MVGHEGFGAIGAIRGVGLVVPKVNPGRCRAGMALRASGTKGRAAIRGEDTGKEMNARKGSALPSYESPW